MTPPPVTVRTVFERFPASVRGAVAIRGADADPHQVRLSGAAVVELASPARGVRDVTVQQATVDIAPHQEVLIPFEIPLAGLEPGWYGVMAEVVVDGGHTIKGPDEHARKFFIPWPRGAVRRGTVEAGVRIEVPGSKGADVDRVECKGDRAVVRWRHEPGDAGSAPEFPEVTVLADGRPLPVLESASDPFAGGRTTVVYPVLARHRTLTFQLDRRNRPGEGPERGPWSADLQLP